MATSPLATLFIDQLQDAYSAETQLTRALPKMAKAAGSPELRAGFEKHLKETEHQVKRLEEVVGLVGCEVGSNLCEAMRGLITEGQEIMSMNLQGEARDAGLIAAAQKVEHYEIALYGTLCTIARQLGHEDAARLLHDTLVEERKTDEALTALAERGINAKAAQKH